MADSVPTPLAAPPVGQVTLSNPTWWSGQTASQGVTIAPLAEGAASNGFSLDVTPLQGLLNPLPGDSSTFAENSVYIATLAALSGTIGVIGYKNASKMVPLSSVVLLKNTSGTITGTDVFGQSGFLFGAAVLQDLFQPNGSSGITTYSNANACVLATTPAESVVQIVHNNGQFWLNLTGAAFPEGKYKYMLGYANGLNAIVQYRPGATAVGLFYDASKTVFPSLIKGLTITEADNKTTATYNSLFAIGGNVAISSTGLTQVQGTKYDLLSLFTNVPSWLLTALDPSSANIPTIDYDRRITMLEKQNINVSTPQSIQYAASYA